MRTARLVTALLSVLLMGLLIAAPAGGGVAGNDSLLQKAATFRLVDWPIQIDGNARIRVVDGNREAWAWVRVINNTPRPVEVLCFEDNIELSPQEFHWSAEKGWLRLSDTDCGDVELSWERIGERVWNVLHDWQGQGDNCSGDPSAVHLVWHGWNADAAITGAIGEYNMNAATGGLGHTNTTTVICD